MSVGEWISPPPTPGNDPELPAAASSRRPMPRVRTSPIPATGTVAPDGTMASTAHPEGRRRGPVLPRVPPRRPHDRHRRRSRADPEQHAAEHPCPQAIFAVPLPHGTRRPRRPNVSVRTVFPHHHCSGSCLNARVSDGRLPVRRRWIGWTVGVLLSLSPDRHRLGLHPWDRRGERPPAGGERRLSAEVFDRGRRPRGSQAAREEHRAQRGVRSQPDVRPRVARVRRPAMDRTELQRGGARSPRSPTTWRPDALTPLLDVAADFDLASLGFAGGAIDLAPFRRDRRPARHGRHRAQHRAAARTTHRRRCHAPAARRRHPHHALIRHRGRDGRGFAPWRGRAAAHHARRRGTRATTYSRCRTTPSCASSGGIIGSIALLHAEGGRITLQSQASTRDFPSARHRACPSATRLIALFEDRPGRYLQNITSIPDFSEAESCHRRPLGGSIRWDRSTASSPWTPSSRSI